MRKIGAGGGLMRFDEIPYTALIEGVELTNLAGDFAEAVVRFCRRAGHAADGSALYERESETARTRDPHTIAMLLDLAKRGARQMTLEDALGPATPLHPG